MSEANDAGAAGSTTAEAGAAEATDFDQEFAAFLGHSFDTPDADAEASGESAANAEPAPKQEEAAPAAKPAEAAPASQDKKDEPAAQPSAETPAGTTEAAASPPNQDVDPADLAAVLGLSDTTTAAPAAAAEPASAETTTSATPAEDEPFTPFRDNFRLPQATVQGLFEAEDPETREKALVNLLSAFGNSITQVVEQRFKEHYAPQLTAQVTGAVQFRQAAAAVNQHFYGKNQDLIPYKKAVQAAFGVVTKKRGDKTGYSEEIADEVAKLARAAIKASGVTLAEPKAAAAPEPARKAPPSKAPGSAFEAGAARPAAAIGSQENGPADLVRDLSEF